MTQYEKQIVLAYQNIEEERSRDPNRYIKNGVLSAIGFCFWSIWFRYCI